MICMRVLVFGTFDDMHTGHVFFLEAAKALGERLIVSVARDGHVRTLKHKDPHQNEQTRLQNVLLLPEVDEVVLSDQVLGSFNSVHSIKPDLIVLGYDQDELAQALAEWSKFSGVEIKTIRLGKQTSAVHGDCTNCSCNH